MEVGKRVKELTPYKKKGKTKTRRLLFTYWHKSQTGRHALV
jgi:hypothetical protein